MASKRACLHKYCHLLAGGASKSPGLHCHLLTNCKKSKHPHTAGASKSKGKATCTKSAKYTCVKVLVKTLVLGLVNTLFVCYPRYAQLFITIQAKITMIAQNLDLHFNTHNFYSVDYKGICYSELHRMQ